MNSNEYMKLADVTGGHGNFDFGKDRKVSLLNNLKRFVTSIEALDADKRAIFYSDGKPDDLVDSVDADILHGVLGIATESQEMVEHLIEVLEGKTEIDKDNLLEETGDLLWYQVRVLRGLGKTLTEAMAGNIAKLQARFPDKFTNAKAKSKRNKKVEMDAMNKATDD